LAGDVRVIVAASCQLGYFINGFKVYYDFRDSTEDNEGITNLGFLCTNPLTGETSGWQTIPEGASIETLYDVKVMPDRMFACGVSFVQNEDLILDQEDGHGLIGFRLVACEWCEEGMYHDNNGNCRPS